MKKSLLTAAALMVAAPALAQTQVPGSKVVYFKKKDPITDQNTSSVFVPEINDTTASTMLMFRCQAGRVDLFLNTKNALLSQEEWDSERTPQLIYRVDAQQPKPLETNGVISDDEPVLEALGVLNDAVLVQAFTNATSKVVIRVMRRDLSPLDYTFATKGFAQAMKAVNHCR